MAEALGLPVVIDPRVIEAANYFEGLRLSFDGALRQSQELAVLPQPLRPSWGEAYTDDPGQNAPRDERRCQCRARVMRQ